MIERINAIKAELEQITAKDASEVEALRIKYLSKKGEISQLMVEFREV
ncbi:MAG: phenylalanine--tRNA ligase subunit alpha, partial [Muribaculaceae bacterium]|nr:phenylalanine--tRNA ligase subunit alpha [Muribaculaceae bacterium]